LGAPALPAPSPCPRHFPISLIGGFRLEDEANCRAEAPFVGAAKGGLARPGACVVEICEVGREKSLTSKVEVRARLQRRAYPATRL
jgi:hypothetical protein